MIDLISRLQQRLEQKLPGMEAQKVMIPEDSLNERFDLDRDDVRLGGVMILLYQKNNEIYLPLIQRQDYEGTHGGQVSFPGGKWEHGDESLTATALRETYEEIGVDVSEIKIIGSLTDLYIPPSNFRVSPVVGYVSTPPVFLIDPYEVSELIEVPLSHLLEDKNLKKTNIKVRGRMRINTPYFDVSEKVVWGATAMMLAEFLTLIREIRNEL